MLAAEPLSLFVGIGETPETKDSRYSRLKHALPYIGFRLDSKSNSCEIGAMVKKVVLVWQV